MAFGEKLRASQELASSYLKTRNDIQQEFDDFTDKVQDMKRKITERANKAIQQGVMKARVEMMLEYQRGEWISWDIEENGRIYNEAYLEDAIIIDVMDEEEPVIKSPKGSPKDGAKGSPVGDVKNSPTDGIE